MTGKRPSRLSQPVRPIIGALTIAIVILLLLGSWAAIDRGAAGYYEFAPGSAPAITDSLQCQAATQGGDLSLPNGKPCARLGVPVNLSHGLDGSLFMVDVLVGPATPGDYLLAKLGLLHVFNDGAQLIPKGAVLGTTPSSQLGCQDTEEMQGSDSSASVVALRRLGYTVTQNDLGAQLIQVQPGSPAARGGLECADVVVAVNGTPVHTSNDLVTVVQKYKPGDTVKVTVNRPPTGKSTSVQKVTVDVHLTGTPAILGLTANPNKPFLGVISQTDTTFTFPFRVTVNVGDIGGPSAGLALTLGLLDVLSSGKLTGGHRVAATGTINLDESVGDVGGVAQKTVAVRRAGAQVFLVPPQELQAAKSEAGSMKVYAVSTLNQALADLQALGGQVPPPNATSTAEAASSTR